MLATINNWRLSSKMTMAFTLIGVVLISVAASGVLVNRYLGEIVERNVSHNLVATVVIGEVLAQVREQRIIVYSRHNAFDDAEVIKLTARLKKNQQALLAAVAQTRTVADASLQPGVDKLEGLVTTLNAVAMKTFAVRASQPLADSLVLIKTAGKDASHDAIAQAELLLKQTVDAAHSANASGKSYAAGALTLAVSLSAIALAGLVGIWYLISRTIARPMADLATATTMLANGHHVAVPSLLRGDELGKIACAVQSFSDAAARRAETDAATAAELSGVTTALAESLKAMSDGDLTKAVTADFPPTYSALKTDFNQTLTSLASLIGSVGDGVSAIRTGAREIAQASEDLARRTENNAASLEETSVALFQIEERIKTSATTSASTVARADKAIGSVGGGRATAEVAVQAMSRVSSSAKGIDSVIEGVDKIAFQTRVLAMNAAVEAGRAGDAGRGFAVVADLVSALALRAEEEAKRARDQLTVTQTEIRTAVEAVQKVDVTFVDIASDVGAVHSLLAGLADDNMAQSTAITEISVAIGTMDRSTQQNAAMVEETSAAARNLTTEVESLAELARTFQINDAPTGRKPLPWATTGGPSSGRHAPASIRAIA